MASILKWLAFQGKTITESRGEVVYGASFVEWFADECRRSFGETIPSPMGSKRLLTIKQPIGVAGLITPVSTCTHCTNNTKNQESRVTAMLIYTTHTREGELFNCRLQL